MNTPDIQGGTTVRTLTFESDGLRLSGTLHLPKANRPPVVIGCHGLMSDSSSPKQIALARQCNQSGLAFFRIDHRGCGASEGLFSEVTSVESRCNDLISAVNLMKKRADIGEPIGFFGSSLGGTVCLAVASQYEAASIVTFAAPIRSDFIRPTPELDPKGRAAPQAIDPHRLRFDLTPALKRIKAIHVFHGQADEVVPVAHAHEIFAAAGKPKKLTLQPGGDHQMSDPIFQKAFIQQAAGWLNAGLQGKAY